MTFSDVAVDAKPEDAEKPVVVVAETFDNLTYTVQDRQAEVRRRLPRDRGGGGRAPAGPGPGKDEKAEKAEQKERRDKDFAETRKRLEERLARERRSRSGPTSWRRRKWSRS